MAHAVKPSHAPLLSLRERAAPKRAVLVGLALSILAACGGEPDPRTLPGMLEYASRAIGDGDRTRLFRVIDPRSRHAMASIVEDRRASARLIRETYPEDQQAAALEQLGMATEAEDAAGLFAQRCDEACMADIAGRLGAPTDTQEDGDELVVRTSRGATLRVRGGGDDWFGIVWRFDELDAERARANQDRQLVQQNAETYRRREAQTREMDDDAVEAADAEGDAEAGDEAEAEATE